MLELAILGLLKERAMHGYQLSKRLADTLGAFWKVSYGSLYPALKRLEREGAVESVFPRDEVGRRKNVYRITEKGERLFYDLLQEAGQESWEDNPFRVRLAFFRYLKPDTRLRLRVGAGPGVLQGCATRRRRARPHARHAGRISRPRREGRRRVRRRRKEG